MTATDTSVAEQNPSGETETIRKPEEILAEIISRQSDSFKENLNLQEANELDVISANMFSGKLFNQLKDEPRLQEQVFLRYQESRDPQQPTRRMLREALNMAPLFLDPKERNANNASAVTVALWAERQEIDEIKRVTDLFSPNPIPAVAKTRIELAKREKELQTATSYVATETSRILEESRGIPVELPVKAIPNPNLVPA